MGRATRSNPIPIAILLVAVTIQGVIPDATIWCHGGPWILSARSCSIWDPSSNECDSAEDVCGPVRSDTTSGMRGLRKRLANNGFELARTDCAVDRPWRLMVSISFQPYRADR